MIGWLDNFSSQICEHFWLFYFMLVFPYIPWQPFYSFMITYVDELFLTPWETSKPQSGVYRYQCYSLFAGCWGSFLEWFTTPTATFHHCPSNKMITRLFFLFRSKQKQRGWWDHTRWLVKCFVPHLTEMNTNRIF